MAHKAVFLDRDGTIIEDPGGLRNPEELRFLPGAARAIRRLRNAGYRAVVVTNQSGLARGLVDEGQLAAVHDRLQQELASQGAGLDGIYYCPYLPGPEAVVEAYRKDSDLRKPRPGMLLQAAEEMELDLSASWMIGNAACDIEAGRAAGCRTVFIGDPQQAPQVGADFVADDLSAAVAVLEQADSARSVRPDRTEGRTEQLLGEVLQRLDQSQRARMYQDFSLAKLAGAVIQVIALGVFGWGLLAGLDGQFEQAGTRLLAALFLQIFALSLLLMHRQS
jgi:D,D-heptose 1,7-bisphosphate phosphatase